MLSHQLYSEARWREPVFFGNSELFQKVGVHFMDEQQETKSHVDD